MTALIILVALVAVPIAEIMVFIEVGGVIGAVPTVALVILTAVVGTALIRWQGLAVLAELRRDLDRGAPPIGAALDGAGLVIAGALLLTPGFLTDLAGFALLVPPLRRAVGRAIARRLVAGGRVRAYGWRGRSPAGPRHAGGTVIEGEFTEVRRTPKDESAAGSPWRATPDEPPNAGSEGSTGR